MAKRDGMFISALITGIVIGGLGILVQNFPFTIFGISVSPEILLTIGFLIIGLAVVNKIVKMI